MAHGVSNIFLSFQVKIPSHDASQSENFNNSIIFSQPRVSQGARGLLLCPHWTYTLDDDGVPCALMELKDPAFHTQWWGKVGSGTHLLTQSSWAAHLTSMILTLIHEMRIIVSLLLTSQHGKMMTWRDANCYGLNCVLHQVPMLKS